MASDDSNDKRSGENLRGALAKLQGASRERLLDALAKYLAEEERRREFIEKMRTI